MRFSKLSLAGFKSFVDPTDLLISDGLTGVVGPNGCGKSNLLEALRWVMGESRPSAVRGGGMEDVIFAGAATRPARNFAEVSLILDNSERLAPAGFNDMDVIEIVRRITRDTGSTYKASGKEARARDVQMLFADASTGAYSPSLVRQGQISELINAKPKNRRRVLEEAAGVSGLYQRRHEAELKLSSTETNLARVDDVLEQLAQQLAQLAKQARQAAQYRAIGEDLRKAEGIFLFLRWRDAENVVFSTNAALSDCTKTAALAEAKAINAAKTRLDAEEKLPPLKEEEGLSSTILQRLIVERDTLDREEERVHERIQTLSAQLEQLKLDIEREHHLKSDAKETVCRLESEMQILDDAQQGFEAEMEEAESEFRDSSRFLQAQEVGLAEKTEDVARLAARHQSAEGLLLDCETLLTKSEKDVENAQQSFVEAVDLRDDAVKELEKASAREVQAELLVKKTEAELATSELSLARFQSIEIEARARRSQADGKVTALKAEVNALSKLVERDTSEVIQIIDQLEVKVGYEKAIGAALSDDLEAAKIEETDFATGWVTLQPYEIIKELPKGSDPLQRFVSNISCLSRRISHVGLVDAALGAKLQPSLKPGQRLVSKEGHLWRWDGFKVIPNDASSTAAIRLQQVNRLAELQDFLAIADKSARAAQENHEKASRELQDAAEVNHLARESRRAADKALTETNRILSRAEGESNLAQSRLESLELTVQRHREDLLVAVAQHKNALQVISELGDLDHARQEAQNYKDTVELSRSTMLTKRSTCDEMRRTSETRTRRVSEIEREIKSWHERFKTAEQRSQQLLSFRADVMHRLEVAEGRPLEISESRKKIVASLSFAEQRCRDATDRLAHGEKMIRELTRAERETERSASEAREFKAASHARAVAAKDVEKQAVQRIKEVLSQTPQQLKSMLDFVETSNVTADYAEGQVFRLKRQRDALGAVNLRAAEDAKEVEGEYDSLVKDKTDLEEAVKTLRNGIANLNREGRERILTAFEQVNTNFSLLFEHLFGGGEANLVMVESDDPLEAGLEIMCQPPGKKLSTMSLLSGGEQTLTALALIFAVFLANPAPICVLDEVDAPLDDPNVARFCDMLDEMCRRTETRFLIITHHAITMARMDRLFGVTMQEQGVSQLVSVDLKKAEASVAQS